MATMPPHYLPRASAPSINGDQAGAGAANHAPCLVSVLGILEHILIVIRGVKQSQFTKLISESLH